MYTGPGPAPGPTALGSHGGYSGVQAAAPPWLLRSARGGLTLAGRAGADAEPRARASPGWAEPSTSLPPRRHPLSSNGAEGAVRACLRAIYRLYGWQNW